MKRRVVAALAAPLLAAMALSACGGGATGPQASAPGTTGGSTAVTLANLGVAQAAPLVLAKDKGIFAKHGITLTITYVEPAAVIPTILSKKADFGYLNAPAVLAARTNGVPVKSVVTTSVVKGDPAVFPIQLMTRPGGAIKSPGDLKGKKIAVDTLFQIPHLSLLNALIASNVDPNQVQVVEVPYANMGTALASGQVDAAQVTEQFGTILRSSGAATDLLSAATGQTEGSPQSILLASEAYINANPKVVDSFRAAVTEATEYAAAHESEYRATLPSFTKLDANLIPKIRFATPSSQDTPAGWQAWADLLQKVGAVKKPVDAKAAYLAR